jgi:hypothetical protein
MGIFSQTAGSTCEFWVNPVIFTFVAHVYRWRARTRINLQDRF